MNREELEKLIIELNVYLSNHASKFDVEKVNFESEQNLKLKFENERTMAAFSNYYLDAYFKSHCYKDYHLSISELQINDFFVDAKEIENLQQNVGGKVIKKDWKYCSVDGYFKVSNLVLQNVNHLFVEYKVQDKISFINLATDYLKFKIYTNNHKSNCIFAYVVFNKGNLDSPIVENGENYYQLLSKDITQKQILNTHVFLYVPPKSIDREGIANTSLLHDSYNKIAAINEIAQQIEDISVAVLLNRNDYNNSVIDGLHKFNSKVIKSLLIRDNFDFIKTLWETANKARIFDNIEDILQTKKESKDFIVTVIEEGSHYLKFFEENNASYKKIKAAKDGLRASYYSSFNLLVVLKFFNDSFDVCSREPKFRIIKMGRGKQAEIVDYNDIAKKEVIRLNKKYGQYLDKDVKISKLAYCVLRFITDLYPLIYNIDDQNKVIDEKTDLKVEKLKQNLSRLYKQFAKEFGHYPKFVYENLGTDNDPFSLLISSIINKIN